MAGLSLAYKNIIFDHFCSWGLLEIAGKTTDLASLTLNDNKYLAISLTMLSSFDYNHVNLFDAMIAFATTLRVIPL